MDLPTWTPAPNAYRVAKFTEASHGFTFSQGLRTNDTQDVKQALLPGPSSYNNMKEIGKIGHLSKSILGGSLEEKGHVDNGMPGPGAYQLRPLHSIPGFVLADLDK